MNIAIIPARGNSKGVPRKNLRLLGGIPLLQWTINSAKNSSVFDYIVITSEDDEILNLSHANKCYTIIRPTYLSSDIVQTSECCLDALRQLQLASINPDTVTILQPTSPFRTSEDIRRAVSEYNLWHNHTWNGTTLTAYKSNKYHWHLEGQGFIPLYHNPEKRLGRQWETDRNVWVENGAIYVVDGERFSREGCYRLPNYRVSKMDELRSVDIDNEEQFLYAQWLLDNGWIK